MHRLVTAQASIRQNMLQHLVPWLHNVELVDPNIAPTNPMDSLMSLKDASQEPLKRPLKGRGWGSPEATNMILNNLFYVTLTVRSRLHCLSLLIQQNKALSVKPIKKQTQTGRQAYTHNQTNTHTVGMQTDKPKWMHRERHADIQAKGQSYNIDETEN